MRYNENNWGVYEKGGTDYSTAAHYTSTAASACNALPSAWGNGGYWVDLFAEDYDVYVCFTNQAALGASVPSATAAGAQAVGLGMIVPAGTVVPAKVFPGCTYMARISPDGSTNLLVMLRSDKGQS